MFNHIGHPDGPKLPCFIAKYSWVKTSWINMRNKPCSKFIVDDVIKQFPWVPPSTSYDIQSLGPCRTPPKFNEVKISSWTKDNIVYLPFKVITLIYGTNEWVIECVYKTMFFRFYEALVKMVKTFRYVCSVISTINESSV